MGTPTWVIPVASLAAICVVGLVFFWWWCPRTWKKGTQEEMKIIDQERGIVDPDAPRDRSWQQQVIARALAKERGEDLSNYEVTAPRPAHLMGGPDAPPPAYTNTY